eukprot:GHVO01022697.1.p1 GENE.GHVO01022697.1~~GHVO01022697.1.p1  ORF type:complete len:928 (+),score=180.84 GHVO01022697.1:366-3149(+)
MAIAIFGNFIIIVILIFAIFNMFFLVRRVYVCVWDVLNEMSLFDKSYNFGDNKILNNNKYLSSTVCAPSALNITDRINGKEDLPPLSPPRSPAWYVRSARFSCVKGTPMDAVRIYDEGIRRHPLDVGLLRERGECYRALGQHDAAIRDYKRVLCLDPTDTAALNGQGLIFQAYHMYDTAVYSYKRALITDPRSPPVRRNLAMVYDTMATQAKNEEDYLRAQKYYILAADTDPSYSTPHYNLGVLEYDRGGNDQAEGHFLNALRVSPTNVEALNNLGAIESLRGNLDEAIVYYRKALTIKPNHELCKTNIAVALNHVGTITKDTKKSKELYKECLRYQPLLPSAYFNLGVAYGALSKIDKSRNCYNISIALNHRSAEALNNLGVIERNLGNIDGALELYGRALSINPNFPVTLSNVAAVLSTCGCLAEAYRYNVAAISLAPHFSEAYNNMGVILRDLGDADIAIEMYDRCLALDPLCKNARQNKILTLNYIYNPLKKDTMITECKAWGEDTMKQYESDRYTHWLVPGMGGGSNGATDSQCGEQSTDEGDSDTDTSKTDTHWRKIRVGYIGPDFFTHSVSYFIHGPLAYHGTSDRVAATVYSNTVREDGKTKILQSYNNCWKSVYGMSVKDIAAMIHNDKIDILVDLAGHTANNCLEVFALRPAPTQITWIGYPATTGLPSVDYRITDATADPPGMEEQYTEALLRLERCFLSYYPPEAPPPRRTVTDFVTFGSFNNLSKIRASVLKVWARILNGLPNSRLLLKAKPFGSSELVSKYCGTFEAMGIDRSRLDLLPITRSLEEHLEHYGLLDIALDPFPYTGTTTTCEALFMGTPVITLKATEETGNTHAHRVGESLLRATGLDELIADDVEGYVTAAIRLGGDRAKRGQYHDTLRGRVLASPLCDWKAFGGGLERAYVTVAGQRGGKGN